MGLFKWANSKVKKFKWWDISLVKLSTAAFVLMIAVLWAPLVSIGWWIYGIIFLVTAIILMFRMFR